MTPHHFSYVDLFAASNDDFIQEFKQVKAVSYLKIYVR